MTLPAREKAPLLCPVARKYYLEPGFYARYAGQCKTIRTLNILDDFSREALSILVDTSLPAHRVIRELEKLVEWRGKPEKIRSDNGPEFMAAAMTEWCGERQITWEFIQPGKPMV